MSAAAEAERQAKVGVLVSGRGSNLQALIEAAATPGYPARLGLVISNRPEAMALARARKAEIPTALVDHKAFPDRQSFEEAIDQHLTDAGIELVVLAGFMRILTPWFTARWEGRIINIHPSLLPSFRGVNTHRAALEAGVKLHGCTVHLVSSELDAGPIIAQVAVPVLPEDTESVLAQRVLEAEHRVLPQALAWLATGRIQQSGNQVRIAGTAIDDAAQLCVPTEICP